MSGSQRSNGTPYARELCVLALVAVGAGALGLAALGVASRLTDRLLLDFRGFAPTASRPEILALFGSAQGVPEQSPLRLTLQLAEPVHSGDFVAAERTFELAPGRYCLHALTFTGPVPRGTPPLEHPLEARVLVDGAIADARVVRDQGEGEPGGVILLEGLQPRAGHLTVRFELRAYGGGAWLHPRAPAVHFETANLRRCPRGEDR